MSVHRVHKTKDFTVICNHHFREKNMSLKAKGLLSLILSLPDEWDYSVAGLVKISKDGRDSVTNALKELEQFGYVVRHNRQRNNKGQWDKASYDIYEKPVKETTNWKPVTENPTTVNPTQENHQQLNTKELNTNKLNTYNNNIYKKENQKWKTEIEEVVEYLNSKTNTNYKSTGEKTQRYIKARLNEGFSVDDFKKVIDTKCSEWLNTDYAIYLRPETLFGSKFEGYLNTPTKKIPKDIYAPLTKEEEEWENAHCIVC